MEKAGRVSEFAPGNYGSVLTNFIMKNETILLGLLVLMSWKFLSHAMDERNYGNKSETLAVHLAGTDISL